MTSEHEQPVNDDGNVLVADFTAQRNNGVLQNIAVSVNTALGYQKNKDNVITAFDDFLTAIQSDTVQVPDETTPIESESESETVNSESESEVVSESESDSQSESDSTLESQPDVIQSESDSQSESESVSDGTSDSTSDSTSALSQ